MVASLKAFSDDDGGGAISTLSQKTSYSAGSSGLQLETSFKDESSDDNEHYSDDSFVGLAQQDEVINDQSVEDIEDSIQAESIAGRHHGQPTLHKNNNESKIDDDHKNLVNSSTSKKMKRLCHTYKQKSEDNLDTLQVGKSQPIMFEITEIPKIATTRSQKVWVPSTKRRKPSLPSKLSSKNSNESTHRTKKGITKASMTEIRKALVLNNSRLKRFSEKMQKKGPDDKTMDGDNGEVLKTEADDDSSNQFSHEDYLRARQLADLFIRTLEFKETIAVRPVDLPIARHLYQFTWGRNGLSEEWLYKNFQFHGDFNCMLLPKQRGPSALLSVVQAYILKYSLFSKPSNMQSSLSLTHARPVQCLCSALTEILCGASPRGSKSVKIVLPGDKPSFQATEEQQDQSDFIPDGLTEKLLIFEFTSTGKVQSFIEANVKQLTGNGRSGCVLFLYSLVLTRTFDQLKSDTAEWSGRQSLITPNLTCSQALINLMLFGRANPSLDNETEANHSNSGALERKPVGLLSLRQYYQKNFKVGSFLKTPLHSIWVTSVEDAWGVLYSTKPQLLNDWRAERIFEAFHYSFEPKIRAEEDQRFQKIFMNNTTPHVHESRNRNDFDDEETEPDPLELTIRTKWRDAEMVFQPILN